jgi:HlyD family secretion protein
MAAKSARAKKSRKKRWILLFLILVAGGSVYAVKFRETPEKVVTLQTEKAQKRTITQVVTASGRIQPETMVKINAEVSGEIIALPFKEGQKVRRGDLVVRIKPDQYQAQVDRVEAALTSARASLALQTANAEKATLEWKRSQELYDRKLISEQECLSARISREIARAQCESAQAGVAQAQASLKEAMENLSKTLIYSPMDGILSQLKSEVGERVSGSSFTQGTEIMTIADLSQMEARVDVGETDIVQIALGQNVKVEVDSYPERKFQGVVSEIANSGKTKGMGSQDEVTSFEVKIRILDKDVTLRPGMSMTADIETITRENVIGIPIQSVTTRLPKPPSQPDSTGDITHKTPPPKQAPEKSPDKLDKPDKPVEVVFLVKDSKAKMVAVKRGICDESFVEVLEGAVENDEVVSGSYKTIHRELEDGMSVKVDNAAKPGVMGKGS